MCRYLPSSLSDTRVNFSIIDLETLEILVIF